MKTIFIIIFSFISSLSVYAQNSHYGVGEWAYHFNFSRARLVATSPERTYCSTSDALFYYDKEDNSVSKFTKSDGLSDIAITAMKYNKLTNDVVIGYDNGNIDIINNREITNVNDITSASITGSKSINGITFEGDVAYLSTSFSVIELDLKKSRINNAFRYIGTDGAQVNAYSTALTNDSIYVSSEEGLLAADRASPNLQDYNNWKIVSEEEGIKEIVSFSDSLYIHVNKENKEDNGIYIYRKGGLAKLDLPGGDKINFLKIDNEHILYGYEDNLIKMDGNKEYSTVQGNVINTVLDAVIEENGKIWIADPVFGLVFGRNESFEYRYPNGPHTNIVYAIDNFGDRTFVSTGRHNRDYTVGSGRNGIYEYSNLGWTSYFPGSQLPDSLTHPIAAQYNEVTNKLYFSCYVSGLFEWDLNTNTFKAYDNTNSPLHKASDYVTKVMGMDVDDQGNLWMCNYESQGNPSIHMLSPDGEFESYYLGTNASTKPTHIVIDEFGTKWLRVDGTNQLRGLIAFDNENNDVRRLREDATNGGLPSEIVNDIAIDKDGYIWVATSQGVAVYNEPQNVFSSQVYEARLPIVEGRPLLQDEIVTSIAVDGGNRKWFGTENGVFLFGPNGEKPILHFTKENSPLPSDIIQDVSIHESTGEVMIGTNIGIVSYWGNASKGQEKHESVKIFPNPVEPDFTGNVGITGLADNTVVKITDVSGQLIYQQDASGGMASWNVKNLNGDRAHTGVYMVFSSNEDGSETFVGKIAVVE